MSGSYISRLLGGVLRFFGGFFLTILVIDC